MCGISGLLTDRNIDADRKNQVSAMTEAISHRGPDGHGIWNDEKIILGHRRLSIIDLSESGQQPMQCQSARYVISYNGEIYNFKEIQKKFNINTRGHSDTEVLIECIDKIGFEETLKELHGMFAIALWDKEKRQLFLARDRFGEKPLYYGLINNELYFSSELKSLKTIKHFEPQVSTEALSAYLKYSYIPTPLCIFSGFKKLTAASYVFGSTPNDIFNHEPKTYWNAEDSLKHINTNTDEESVVSQLESILSKVIQRQMISDVPLGSFLSGGIDSSLVTSLMQKNSTQAVKSFTIGFQESQFDESQYAREVAAHLGTDHTEWIISEKEALDLIPSVTNIYDEPFSDSSQLPTCLLAKMTRQKVTVCLSGDGGDELFAGYNRYLWAEEIFKKIKKSPKWSRSMMTGVFKAVPGSAWNGLNKLMGGKTVQLGHKIQKVSDLFMCDTQEDIFDHLLSTWPKPNEIHNQALHFKHELQFKNDLDFTQNMMFSDARNYLIDDLMVKVDRATMASSLESRTPFLDHELFEFSQTIPIQLKLKGQTSKYLLKKLLYKYIPQEMVDRPKQGFAIPLSEWFRSLLKDWLQDELKDCEAYGIDRNQFDKILAQHMNGSYNHQEKIWNILVLISWLKSWNIKTI